MHTNSMHFMFYCDILLKIRWVHMDRELELKIKEIVTCVFEGVDFDLLSQYQKRKMIFSYLCDLVNYDVEFLKKIRDNAVYGTPISRSPKEELRNVILNNKGICSAISQYYKLLLEEVKITSYCVICDDGTPVNHQLSLVYDSDSGVYSFDDITSVIVNKGNKSDFFDYDIEGAKSKGQGLKKIMDNEEFVILPEDYINYLVGREKSFSEMLKFIPRNICSIKNLTKTKEM